MTQKKNEEINKTKKVLAEQVAFNKKIQEAGQKAGYDVGGQLNKSTGAFSKGNIEADIARTKSGIEEMAALRQKGNLSQQQLDEKAMRDKKALETAALDSKMISLNAANKKSMEQRKADFEYDKLVMQQAGKSEIEIAKYVKKHKDDIADNTHKNTLAKIAIEHQKEVLSGKIGDTIVAKRAAAQKDLDSQLYENQKQLEMESLKIKEKSYGVMLSYYQYMEPTAQKTLDLLKRQWEIEAQRIQAQLEEGQTIDQKAYVRRKEEELSLKQKIDNLEYEENKKMSLLAIDERRGMLSAEYIATERLSSYQKLLDMYEKELKLKQNDANAQLTIKKKMDDVTRAMIDQNYQLEIMKGSFGGGLVQGIVDYYNQMKTTFDYGKQVVGDFASVSKDSIGTVFKDLKKGELKNFADYFTDFCDKLSDKWIDMLSEMLTNWIVTGNMMKSASTGGEGAFGGLLGMAAKLLGFGGASTEANYSSALGGIDWRLNAGETAAMGYHAGGIVGKEASFAKAVPSSTFASAPRYHNGLQPSEFPAILKKGEGVFTEGQMEAMSAGNAPTLVVNVENKTGSQVKATQSQPSFDGKKYIRTVILELADSDMAVRQKFGAR